MPSASATELGGTVTINADGSFTYTPPIAFEGYDTFEFTYNDFAYDEDLMDFVPLGGTHTGTVRMLVEGEEPIAVDDRYTVLVGETISANVLSNDRSPPGTPIDAAFQTTGVEILIGFDGSFTFTATDPGVYVATYEAIDNLGRDSDGDAIVRITVLAKPPPPKPPGSASGSGWGDPHFVTFDGLSYDMQGWGEYVLTRATSGVDFEVQIRTRPWHEGAQVTIIEAAVAKLGNDVVQVNLDGTVLVNGVATTLVPGSSHLVLSDGAGLWHVSQGSYVFARANGEQVRFDGAGSSYMNVSPAIGPGRANAMEGILGDYNANSADDIQLADGTVLTGPVTTTQLYGEFAAAWRLTDASSLFTYDAGEGTDDFQRPDFPPAPLRLEDLPADVVAAAAAIVDAAGITDPALRDAAILDLVLTGDEAFLQGAQQAPEPEAELEIIIPPPPPLIGLTSPMVEVTEGNSGTVAITFGVFRTGDTTAALDLQWAVQALGLGFADAADFGGTLPSGTVTIAAGETSAQIVLNVSGDTMAELDETVRIALVNAPAGYVVTSGTAQGEVLNDDGPVLPVVANDGVTTGPGQAVQVDALANDSDPLGQALTVTDIGIAANGGVSLVGGVITYTPNAGFTGTDSFTYTARDPRGGEGSATVTVTVVANALITGTGAAELIDSTSTPPGQPFVGAGNDTVRAGGGADSVSGLAGADSLFGEGDDDLLDGGDDKDWLFGGAGNDTLLGGALGDFLRGEDGDDVLDGGIGADDLRGGTGDDRYLVTLGDRVTELAGGGTDTVISRVSWMLAAEIENLELIAGRDASGTGNELANRILGNARDNVLMGLDGNDSVDGGFGDDTILGGAGADTLHGDRGRDVFRFNAPAEGGDRIIGYVGAFDSIEVSAAGFGGGLVAGMDLLAAGRYAQNNRGVATANLGQFVFDHNDRTLLWDADGTGAGAAVLIADLAGAIGWTAAEINVIA